LEGAKLQEQEPELELEGARLEVLLVMVVV